MDFVFAEDVPSAVTRDECHKLAALAEGKAVLELGAHLGRSTIALCSTARIVHSVDWHLGDIHAGHMDSLPKFIQNLAVYKLRQKVVAHVGRFADVLPLFRSGLFDLAFLDGLHQTTAVEDDTRMILPLMKPGGIIAFHDYGQRQFGVTEAVDRFVKSRNLRKDGVRTLAVVYLP